MQAGHVAAWVGAVALLAVKPARTRAPEVSTRQRVTRGVITARSIDACVEMLARFAEISGHAVALVTVSTCCHACAAMLARIARACVKHVTSPTGVSRLASARVLSVLQCDAATDAARVSRACVEMLTLSTEELTRAVTRVRRH